MTVSSRRVAVVVFDARSFLAKNLSRADLIRKTAVVDKLSIIPAPGRAYAYVFRFVFPIRRFNVFITCAIKGVRGVF